MPLAETYLAKSTDVAARILGDETIVMSTAGFHDFYAESHGFGYLGGSGRQYSAFTHHS